MTSNIQTLKIQTQGEKFYEITDQVKAFIHTHFNGQSGVLTLFNTHTSCGLTVTEAFASTARTDMEKFLKHLAPRNLAFIEHTDEGSDDSPSHMKSLLLQTSLSLILEKGELVLGQWQGIYLCEFRDDPKTRTILARLTS